MKAELLYEGKAKQVYRTNTKSQLVLSYKNDATAFNGKKKAFFEGKGRLNNEISSRIFTYLQEQGISSHFIKRLNETEQLVHETAIIPLEVVIRNVATGSILKRLGLKEGMPFQPPLIELFYKNDELDDPLINDDHALLLTNITVSELKEIKAKALEVNTVLRELYQSLNLDLIDFKLEFGRSITGEIVLADEISPDTCRLWDRDTREKMDKDVFRQGTGDLLEVYEIILHRLEERK
ncbi:phosphoribosylaminoimidazolesuccinocarboxamide synthase [Ornithinibacillus halophilus]|uniref:Phosphoribosylaminoimidazole-succinocarboxamide synthase n=1 Tax=Ornithinibacillus halophilus TaxID=930117 RepID=A0A1M5ESQ3_9BACI|nr:phosphoribosylaminoimidazolesuccinocarboxamide synthase [Ornithinibacillus halophilus]SHF82176.1 phosphoribosylaminoimidazole-succinocarboxamide synthase [Ornithinibacillus halophilus]